MKSWPRAAKWPPHQRVDKALAARQVAALITAHKQSLFLTLDTPNPVALHIGGQQLCFRGLSGLRIEPPSWSYPDFISNTPQDHPKPDIEILVSNATAPADDALQTRFDTGDAWRISSAGNKRRIEMIPRTGPQTPHWCADTDTQFANVHLYCADHLLNTDVEPHLIQHLVQYPLDQILLVQHLLAARKGMLVHAAGAIRRQGSHTQGVIFPGISGAGKSTLTRQLLNNSDWQFVSDDRVVLRVDSEQVALYGTPWPGDAQVALNLSAPLTSLCFLCQSDHSGLESISKSRALERLLPVTSIPWYDRSLLSNALDLCEQVINRTPIYELHFQRHDSKLEGVLDSLP